MTIGSDDAISYRIGDSAACAFRAINVSGFRLAGYWVRITWERLVLLLRERLVLLLRERLVLLLRERLP